MGLLWQMLGGHDGGGDGHGELTPAQWWTLAGVCALLVVFAGTASGLTLGLMSLDSVDMEVLKRSGTDAEKRYASRIIPVIANEHFLLVTLLLCNAAATEALPLFLDRLADPLTAVVLSTSVVLVFGEVLPQAVCSRYGLMIGASAAWFVRLLMFLCAPLAWPIGKLLDVLLGGEHTALFRRAQLKALVGLHAEEEGLGGTLSVDEISVICGALDLTHKTAWAAMTPLSKVFALPVERVVDEACLQDILSRGHSRVPVYTNGDRSCIVGLLLAKELVLVDPSEGLTVGQLPMRTLPQLAASTPLYDMLKLFESGGSHMALLTRPHTEGGSAGEGGGARTLAHSGSMARARSGLILLGAEIVDETDLYVDNEQATRVDVGELSRNLPARLRRVLARGDLTPRVGAGARLGHLGMARVGVSLATAGEAGAGLASSPSAAGSAGSAHAHPHGHARRAHPQPFFLRPQPSGADPLPSPDDWAGGLAGASPPRGGGPAVAGSPVQRAASSEPVAIRPPPQGSSGGGSGGTPATGSWAAGANSGARRVRFGGDALRGAVVLKPRLVDPEDEPPQRDGGAR
ncbi:hypothetical protein Rsub_12834 [Raphidocelis subcapitata]|uniref:CNNM transmembrane domain-containing protein n=1 Tax=Raphidocelis subcapitata TaxID=307507 RepID=A0A2V0PM36_9CHLO|nr:hypothetical protein Rsub_12834 [Raphidocelis subcapitata]|eukprot:GBG00143.1 hypothetical protein Rsub_12834 [Raphidocelis subcapitata]